ncbi:hypothetical protein J6590_011370 [Homalodisca vitripennis]|nr:hypothetical protein J6590_011370 [Homalodisca vitripennis]
MLTALGYSLKFIPSFKICVGGVVDQDGTNVARRVEKELVFIVFFDIKIFFEVFRLKGGFRTKGRVGELLIGEDRGHPLKQQPHST